MRTLVTVAVLTLGLTGCFDNPKKTALRESLIRLQATVGGGLTQARLYDALVTVDTDAQIAHLDKAVSMEQLSKVNDVLTIGRQVGKGWSNSFYCPTTELGRGTPSAKSYYAKECVQSVIDYMEQMGLDKEKIKQWRDREAADDASGKAFDISTIRADEPIRAGLSLLDDAAAEAVAALQH